LGERAAPVRIALLYILALATCICMVMPVEASPLPLDGQVRNVSGTGHIETFYDPQGTLSVEQACAPTTPFTPISGNFNGSYTPKGAWWLRLKVEPGPAAGGAWWLEIFAPYTDRIDAYVPDADADDTVAVRHKEAGALKPFGEREWPTFTNILRVELIAGQPADLCIRLSGKRALNARLVLWRQADLVGWLTLNILVVSLAVGAALIVSVGALIIAAWLRSASFGWYGVYVGAVSLNFLANSGFWPVLLPSLEPASLLRIQSMVGCFSIMAGAFMARAIFRVPAHAPIANKIILAIGIVAGASIPASALGYYGIVAPYLMAGILILALLGPWLAVRMLLRGEPAAMWYLVGFSAYCAATIWFALVVLGLAPLNDFLEWGYQSAGLLHMAATFAGLASALQAGMRERQRLEAELLQASQRNMLELERAVEQRTAALNEEVGARRRAETALLKALKEQRNFLGMVSHEFRTPLSTLRLSVTLLERGVEAVDEALKREVEKMRRAILRLSGLIDTFLAEEWLERAAMTIQRRTLDIGALTADVVREHAAHAQGRIERADCPPITIEGDPVLLRTVVDNLVGNALKYTEKGIFVSVTRQDGGALICVEDRGPGIPAGERDEIFDRYYRAPEAVTKSGTGLGLHLVRLIVEKHGGHVRLTDAREGGSRFEAWLPERLPPLSPGQAEDARTPQAADGGVTA
jgi:signal transduction histidine kinase